MVIRIAPPLAVLVVLAACQTTSPEDWTRHQPNVPFSQADNTCEQQARNIEEEENRPEFFAECMAALGWTPVPGAPYATPATAPDPT